MAHYPQEALGRVGTGAYGQVFWIDSRCRRVPLALHPKDVYNAYSPSRLTFTVTHRRSYA